MAIIIRALYEKGGFSCPFFFPSFPSLLADEVVEDDFSPDFSSLQASVDVVFIIPDVILRDAFETVVGEEDEKKDDLEEEMGLRSLFMSVSGWWWFCTTSSSSSSSSSSEDGIKSVIPSMSTSSSTSAIEANLLSTVLRESLDKSDWITTTGINRREVRKREAQRFGKNNTTDRATRI